ncbi:MAG TPA: hypothetical protein VF498_05945 [Anaerolineales bacterium]
MSTMINDPRLITDESQMGWFARLRSRLGRADLGSLPILIGLLAIWIIFQAANPLFLSPVNLTNLLLQMAGMGTIATGLVMILLLGEIDLSAGILSGLCAAVMAVLNVKLGIPGPIAVLIALLVGAAIGTFHGFWITKLRLPSFIVTLAGNIGWQGVLLYVLGNTGTINLRDKFITGFAFTFFPKNVGWAVAAVFILIYISGLILARRRRLAAGLTASSIGVVLAKAIVVSAGILGTMALLNANRGLPLSLVIFIGVVILFSLITQRTLFGRHIYAVGGNAEAARRASIPVDQVRILVFAISSTLSALGGVMLASRLLAVNQSSGGSDLLLNSIAAAVIGGTSLFGGRGIIWAALLGALVIQSISNGMDLLALASPIKFMITGGVLLIAVTIDALARRRRESTGR